MGVIFAQNQIPRFMFKSSSRLSLTAILPYIAIPIAVVVAYFIYTNVLGNPENFVGNDPANEPAKGNYFGVIYKGGMIVVLLISFQIILLTFIIERFISIGLASGFGGVQNFIIKVREHVSERNYDAAVDQCGKHRGSVASVLYAGLNSFNNLRKSNALGDGEMQIMTLQKEMEEATQLELPELNRNMPILSTLASVSTLIGLLGTVTGMIKAFSALARVGQPDAVGLANGISQALVTTALGISTAAVAIVFFNFLSTRIDKIIYAIDEATYTLVNTLKIQLASGDAKDQPETE
jgi:biopolymer transport protein ExbB